MLGYSQKLAIWLPPFRFKLFVKLAFLDPFVCFSYVPTLGTFQNILFYLLKKTFL